MKPHGERAHSKFSASGAQRWFNCPGSVELSEGLPDKSSHWAEEGTKAHEVLENILTAGAPGKSAPREMINYAAQAAKFIKSLWKDLPESSLLVEDRIYLAFIHPEMFGTFDSAVVDHFGTLHVFDFKYGAGHSVSPKENLQMLFYGIGLAHHFDWNFKMVRLWIIQPRVRGYDGPLFWDVTIDLLKAYAEEFALAVQRVEREPDSFAEGSWCHWCKAKGICPLKQEARLGKAKELFRNAP